MSCVPNEVSELLLGNTSDATPSADTVYSKLNMGTDQKDQGKKKLMP